MSSESARNVLSPASWISIIPAFVAITVNVIMGQAVHVSLAGVACGLLTIVGVAPMFALIQAAEAESARGSSRGHFIARSLVLAGTFMCCLLVTSAIALEAELAPAPFVWILIQTLGVAPAAVTAAILTGRSRRLPFEP